MSDSPSPQSMIDLKTCNPSQLAEWMRVARFGDDNTKAANFFRSAADEFESTVTKSQTDDAVTIKPSWIDQSEASEKDKVNLRMVLPARTRLALVELSKEGLTFQHKSTALQIPFSAVTDMIVLGEESNPNKSNAERILLVLKPSEIMWKLKPLNYIGWFIPTALETKRLKWQESYPHCKDMTESLDYMIENATTKSSSDSTEPISQLCKLWVQALGTLTSSVIYIPTLSKRRPFSAFSATDTSTTTADKPFIACYYGTNDGTVYPLHEGILYLDTKQALYLPRHKLASVQLGQNNGGRYISWTCELYNDDADQTTSEVFSNIHRDELPSLERYVHHVLIPAMKKDAANDGNDTESMVSDTNDNDDDTDDEDAKPSRKRPRRKALENANRLNKQHFTSSKAAKAMDSEEDEDADFDDDSDDSSHDVVEENEVQVVDYIDDDDDEDDEDEDDDDDEEVSVAEIVGSDGTESV